jgi:hypothetical protein
LNKYTLIKLNNTQTALDPSYKYNFNLSPSLPISFMQISRLDSSLGKEPIDMKESGMRELIK